MPYVSVSGLPGSGLGNGCDHLHHSVAAHPPVHHVLLSGQQLVQPPLPQRHSKLQLEEALKPAQHIHCHPIIFFTCCTFVLCSTYI